ncbi:RNA-binding S4 domain-containing protein [Fodinicurvata halophila]|uniref:RNA-binding S4 domain-containing protein n=1 Tax=Fodinicurvata halophila TaxID=1419723 RepID=A0ABV8UNG5_9PROT
MSEERNAQGADEGFLRLDKWLFFARFYKSRSLATRACEAGEIRIGGSVVRKANHRLRIGDVLTFSKGPYVRVIRVTQLPGRRGPASEAQESYEDLNPVSDQKPLPRNTRGEGPKREPGAGRPTKRERRQLDRFRGDG